MDKDKYKEGSLRYFHRDLSWLLFNRRVIEKAYDEDYPILEQFRFLAIASSNLDEFFEVRVPEMRLNARHKPNMLVEGTGFTHAEILDKLKKQNQKNLDLQYHRFEKLVSRLLAGESVKLKRYVELTEGERVSCEKYFSEVIFPTLSPVGLDTYRATPRVKEKLIYLFVHLVKDGEEAQAVLPLPVALDRLVKFGQTYTTLEEIIMAHFDRIFLGWDVKRTFTFRITYDKNLDFDEDPNEDMVEQMEEYLEERSLGSPSRVEVAIRDGEKKDYNRDVEFLKEELDLKKRDFYYFDGPLDLTFLNAFISEASKDHAELIFPPFEARHEVSLEKNLIFNQLDAEDILLQHPYDSYDSVIDFLTAASEDPNTIVIKQTLYRVAADSRVVKALIAASKAGKQVSAVVELKARFDEENNLHWVDELQEAGVFVSFGVPEMKTHGKLILVVKKMGRATKTYVHIGTGNYNEKTARLYTDLSLLSSNPVYGRDLTALFNHLSSYSEIPTYENLAVSPQGIETMILAHIDAVIRYHQQTGAGRIFIKTNAVTSKPIVEKLYEASQAGVKVLLIVRGACILRPEVEGLSDNIEVRSVIGRFLEHSRIYAFTTEMTEIWISSADIMTRNMRNRVEIAARLVDRAATEKAEAIIATLSNLTKKVFFLTAQGHYKQEQKTTPVSPQTYFVEDALKVQEKGLKEVSLQVETVTSSPKKQGFFARWLKNR